MSTSGIISTTGSWDITPTGGNVNLKYSNITRSSPQYTKTISISAGTTNVTLFNTDEITVEGIYLMTIAGGFNSTPWVLRHSCFMPMGYTRLVQGTVQYAQFSGRSAVHDGSTTSYVPSFYHNNVSSNYQRSGLIMLIQTLAAGSITVNLYRVA